MNDFRNKLILFCTAILLACTMVSFCFPCENDEDKENGITRIQPYFGIEHQLRYMDHITGFGENIFNSKYHQHDIFGGIKINDFISLEIGYQTTNTRPRTSNISSASLGLPPLEPPELHITKNRLKGLHANIILHSILYEDEDSKLELLHSIGHSRLKIFYQDVIVHNAEGPQNVFCSERIFHGSKSLFKAGVGAQYILNNNGIRFIIIHENTGRFKNFKPTYFNTNKSLSLKNSVILNAGIFFMFY